MKKKKKSKKAKTAFDLEAFEKELNQSKKSTGGEDDDEEDGPVDTSHLDNIDEAELGDDPFAHEAPSGIDAGNEAWLKSDRDYTYQEVRAHLVCSFGIA